MSPELLSFLEAYAKWAYEDDAPQNKPFDRYIGLCNNIFLCYNMPLSVCRAISQELKALLHAEFGDTHSPFGIGAYEEAFIKGTQHLDRRRRRWVLSQIAKAKA